MISLTSCRAGRFSVLTPIPIASPSGTACPRTQIPFQGQSPDSLFVAFAPGLEWRTIIDTHYPVQNSQKVYIRATARAPVIGTMVATLRGSDPPLQVDTQLEPTYPADNVPWPGDPAGTVRLIGGVELPRPGCWDFDFQVNQLEGTVVVQAP